MSDTFIAPEILSGGSTASDNVERKTLDKMSMAEAVDLADRWFDRCTDSRVHIENQALLNLAFFLGQQYVNIDPTATSSRVVPTKAKRGQVRTVDNIIDPAVRQEMARLLRTRPFGTVIPQGEDPEDYEAAQAAEAAIEHVQREGGWEEALEQATLWSLLGSTGHIGVSYEETLSDSFGQKGLISFRALSPFEFAVPHLRRPHLDDQPYVMVTKAFELEEIEDRWGKKVMADRAESFGSYDERLNAVISGQGRERQTTSAGRNRDIPVAVVKEIWIRPSPIAPEGAVLVVASKTVLDFKNKWPDWCNGQYPFAKVSYTPIAGAYWGKSMVADLVPLQRRHNRAASVLVELMGMLSHTAISAPRGTKVKSILGGRGTMMETPPGMSAPTVQLNVQNAGNLPIQELEQTRQSLRDNAFFHEVSRGTTPPNVRSGTAIVSLKELDDAPASIPIRGIERATQRMGRFSLNLVKEKWDEQRMVLVMGTDGDIEMRSFVNSQGAGGQYWVQPGSAWPLTKGQRQSMVTELFTLGLIAPEEALAHLEVGTPRGIRNDRSLDKRHARRENQKYQQLSPLDQNGQVTQQSIQAMMSQAMMLNPAEWHSHVEHLREHDRVRKSPTYERWAPWKKQLFEAHIVGHRAALEQQLLQQAMGPGGAIRGAQEQQAGAAAAKNEALARVSERVDKNSENAMRQQELALQAAQAQASQQQAQQ